MKQAKKVMGLLTLSLITALSCTNSNDISKDIVGKYASTGENEYDHFKDTIEVKQADDGKFDIQKIADWSAAKEDDPTRPNKNKKAGEWNNKGIGKIEVATLQMSDKTLRITDPMFGTVRVFMIDLKNHSLERQNEDGTRKIYRKVN